MRAFLLCLLVLHTGSTAFGWGCRGHHIVALMARAQLKSGVSAEVDKLLKENPIDPKMKRFCWDRPTDILADVSTWADDQRTIEESTFGWHFVDIPMGVTEPPASGLSVSQWCHGNGVEGNPQCVTEAIKAQWKILLDKTRPASERAVALRYLVHLVGDTQQPLHDSDNRDQGGNCTTMKFLAEDRLTNLHSVWDTKLIERDMAVRKLGQPGYAALLAGEFAKQRKAWSKEKINPELWVWQGHAIAVKLAYGLISPAIPLEQPGPDFCDAETAKVAAMNITLDQSYVDRSLPAVHEQLARSASRLANLLNQSF